MSKKVQIMAYITVMVMALSLTAILYMLMPECDNCGSKFCFGQCEINAPGQDNPIKVNPSLSPTNQTTTLLKETPRQDESYFDNVYFIGDSRTVGLMLYGVPESHIFAENGLNHESAMTKECVTLNGQTLVSIPDAVMITAPEIMIVNFGINGASWMSVDSFMESYEKLIEKLVESSPHSILVIESIMPVAEYYEYSENGCTNEKLDEINDRLYEYAKSKGYFFLDTASAMKNENNDLRTEFIGEGGIHFTDAAYDLIIDYILTHAIIKQ